MNITIFSTTTCSFCHALMGWLDSKHIEYTSVVVDEDAVGMADFMNKNDGMLGVPFSIITDLKGNETKITGYDQKKFKEVLGL